MKKTTITFILPAIGKKPGEKYIGTWKMEPLTIAVLKSLTPERFDTVFFDDRIELIDYGKKTDIVAITVETYTAKRAYRIASAYRERGVPVVLGGYHVALFPEEAQKYADAILTGNAETMWPALLEDFSAGALRSRYDGAPGFQSAAPDRSLFAGKKYLPISLIETGRGCVHNCNFCAISQYYRCRYYKRDIEDILRDVSLSPHKYHFLVDDNLTADKAHAEALFSALTPHRIKWAGQGTLAMASDPAFLKAMKKSGCELILIGFESLEEESLRQMKKGFMTGLAQGESVRRIHDAGIGIYATFVMGYDGDTPATIERTVAFAEKHKFYTAAFNHLLPYPGTQLYRDLQQGGRLLHDAWWLAEDYNYGELAFRPKHFTPEELSRRCHEARREFSAGSVVLRRGLHAMRHTSPLMWSLFWAMNLRLGTEVDEKMNVPIGENLDELPK